MLVNSYIQHSCTVNEHRFVVPLDHRKTLNAPASTPQTLETIEIFAREVIRPGGEDLPYLAYLQGGPGFGAPRSGDFRDGWLGRLLDDHRLALMRAVWWSPVASITRMGPSTIRRWLIT